ncbi:MAG TPA: hypothetical protein VIL54_03680 [Natronosporangium sp.]
MSGSHIERAELLADLGRYQEAAEELSDLRPDDVAGYTLLSRIRLASGDLRGALAAADMAVAAAPDDIGAQVARGMALADLGRVDEAAEQAERLLRHGSADGYACTSAAAILAQVRNGQVALDAAWQGVRLSPDQPRAHLVLGVVAAGLGLSDIAARAYREALELDPRLPVPQAAAGIVRTEQQRYVSLLSRLTGETPTRSPGRRTGPVPPRQGGGAGGDRARRRASGPDGGGRPRPRGADAGQGPARPPGPAVERDLPSGRRVGDPGAGPGRGAAPGDRGHGVDGTAGTVAGRPGTPAVRVFRPAAGVAVLAPLAAAWAYAIGVGAGVVATLLAALAAVTTAGAWQRLPAGEGGRVRAAVRAGRRVAVAAVATTVVPVLLIGSAATGEVWPLAVATAAGVVAAVAVARDVG